MVAGKGTGQQVERSSEGSIARDIVFAGLWLIIASVSVHDGYRALCYRSVLADLERNPLALLLMRLDRGHVTLLLVAKTVGTVTVCALLLKLYSSNNRIGLQVCGVLALLQLLLLLYLEYLEASPTWPW